MYLSDFPNIRMPTQEKAINWMEKRRKKMLKSINIAKIILIKGPNVFVSYSMSIILIQKKKAVAAISQSK